MKKRADVHHPTLIMVRGLPGSGKSYLAAELEKILGKEQVVMLAPDPDTIDLTTKEYLEFSKELTREELDPTIHPFRWLRKLACDAISEHKIVIWSQPFTARGIFERLVAYLETYAHEHSIRLPVLLVEVEIHHTKARERVSEREQVGGHAPSDNTFARRLSEYESYTDGYRTVTVRGEDDVAISSAAVINALQELEQSMR